MGLFSGLTIAEVVIVLAITILPSVFLFSLIMYSDRKSKEPVSMILLAVLSGIFTVCVSLLIDKYTFSLSLIFWGEYYYFDMTLRICLPLFERMLTMRSPLLRGSK